MFKEIIILSCIFAAAIAQAPTDCNPINEVFQDCVGKPTVKSETTCENFYDPSKDAMIPCVSKCVCKPWLVRDTASNSCVFRFRCSWANPWWPWGGKA